MRKQHGDHLAAEAFDVVDHAAVLGPAGKRRPTEIHCELRCAGDCPPRKPPECRHGVWIVAAAVNGVTAEAILLVTLGKLSTIGFIQDLLGRQIDARGQGRGQHIREAHDLQDVRQHSTTREDGTGAWSREC